MHFSKIWLWMNIWMFSDSTTIFIKREYDVFDRFWRTHLVNCTFYDVIFEQKFNSTFFFKTARWAPIGARRRPRFLFSKTFRIDHFFMFFLIFLQFLWNLVSLGRKVSTLRVKCLWLRRQRKFLRGLPIMLWVLKHFSRIRATRRNKREGHPTRESLFHRGNGSLEWFFGFVDPRERFLREIQQKVAIFFDFDQLLIFRLVKKWAQLAPNMSRNHTMSSWRVARNQSFAKISTRYSKSVRIIFYFQKRSELIIFSCLFWFFFNFYGIW